VCTAAVEEDADDEEDEGEEGEEDVDAFLPPDAADEVCTNRQSATTSEKRIAVEK